MKIEEYFEEPEELEIAKRIFSYFHDSLFLQKNLSDAETILLAAYMLANKNKSNHLDRQELENLFITLGKKKDNFRKRLRDISGNKNNYLLNQEKTISITPPGLSYIRGLIRSNKDG